MYINHTRRKFDRRYKSKVIPAGRSFIVVVLHVERLHMWNRRSAEDMYLADTVAVEHVSAAKHPVLQIKLSACINGTLHFQGLDAACASEREWRPNEAGVWSRDLAVIVERQGRREFRCGSAC